MEKPMREKKKKSDGEGKKTQRKGRWAGFENAISLHFF
jgi:hypothetical protein